MNQMCKRGILLALCLSAMAQTLAPTKEQCRADVHRWFAETKPNYETALDALTIRQLMVREVELHSCAEVDAAQELNYQRLVWLYTFSEGNRYIHFMQRHHLYDQFLSEDAKGAR
jgi:hypothetical protein